MKYVSSETTKGTAGGYGELVRGIGVFGAAQSTLYSLQVTGSLLLAGLVLYAFARLPKRKRVRSSAHNRPVHDQ